MKDGLQGLDLEHQFLLGELELLYLGLVAEALHAVVVAKLGVLLLHAVFDLVDLALLAVLLALVVLDDVLGLAQLVLHLLQFALQLALGSLVDDALGLHALALEHGLEHHVFLLQLGDLGRLIVSFEL